MKSKLILETDGPEARTRVIDAEGNGIPVASVSVHISAGENTVVTLKLLEGGGVTIRHPEDLNR